MVLTLGAPGPSGPGAPVRVPEGVMGRVRMALIGDPSDHRPDEKFDDRLADKLDDEDYPAYSMGRAAEILGVTPAFLRTLDATRLIKPQRSEGGHRRYSRYQLRLAARVREMVDEGTALEAACRIVILEDQLAEALRINAELKRRAAE
jgi:hypothetical protein